MKSQAVDKQLRKGRQLKYPVLMESVSGIIVLFTDNNRGTVVHNSKREVNDDEIGEFCDEWRDADDQSWWTPYKGNIILSNDDDDQD